MSLSFRERWRIWAYPKPQVGQLDTSLRYTDILFGFVIRELFTRLKNWPVLSPHVREHLVVGTILVLGSWIGYRRSLNRSQYEVKFFNMPLVRFVLDQFMLVLYFRLATLTPSDLGGAPLVPPAALAAETLWLVLLVFGSYVAWDLFGLLMAVATNDDGPVYPKVNDKTKEMERGQAQKPDRVGFMISFFGFALVALLWATGAKLCSPVAELGFAALLLLGYRFAKEVRTSLRRDRR